jgi:N-6 DNA Methylase
MDESERLHHEWIGMAQPEGLVVTAAALKAAEANITEPVIELQAALRALAGERRTLADLRGFAQEILGWSDEFLVGAAELPPGLRVRLDGGELLAPTMAVRSADAPDAFVLLVEETHRRDLDAASDDPRWTATATQRFCRLLTETGVPAGLLTNGRDFRLVYAPRRESPGWIHFRLDDLLTVDGRPLLGAFHMLLNERRLLSVAEDRRLGALLKASREYQNTVSTRLQEQVLRALGDLLSGLQEADRLAEGRILQDWRREKHLLQEVYAGLVTVLMRMVFLLYAEEKRLLPMESELYAASYSLSRLHAQLTEDRARHGDTLEDRYGAWGRLITLFRLLHDGARAAGGKLILAPRKGRFFNPDVYPFLEGRPRGSERQSGEVLELPRVSDGVVYRALDRLLVLEGERLRYRELEVEHIGSVYEGLMGFELELAEGDSLAVLPHHVVVDLEALLRKPGPERVKALQADADLELKDKAAGQVKAAGSVAELVAALAKRASPRFSGPIAKGSLYLQPGQERRRSGSHYTPRKLTQPIVETALRPVLERLGPEATPEAILELKVCDPAMGSGAFLVEACRQLAERLVEAWRRSGRMPELPLDEDPALHARRLIAQRCLYGVDKNRLAVDLARLSLWLETFAREHPFTFVNHSLRHGDSLVGLGPEQIYNFSFEPEKKRFINDIARNQLLNAVRRAEALRKEIHALGDPPSDDRLKELWDEADHALSVVR